jgi:hypothetical protein
MLLEHGGLLQAELSDENSEELRRYRPDRHDRPPHARQEAAPSPRNHRHPEQDLRAASVDAVEPLPTQRPGLGTLVGASLLAAGVLTLGLAEVVRGSGDAVDRTARTALTPTAEIGAPGPAATSAGEAPFALWGLDRAGGPLRWNPCAPVPFELNLSGATVDAERDVLRALDLLGTASGLDLVVVGATDERPRVDRSLVEFRSGGDLRWRPVLIAWATPGEGGLPLTLADRGVALPVAVRDGDHESIVTGQVILNASRRDLVPGFDDRSSSIGATILHEIAHVLGLAHVSDPAQIMAEDPGTGPVALGPGDVAGLRAIGVQAGCLATPSPTAGRGLIVSP